MQSGQGAVDLSKLSHTWTDELMKSVEQKMSEIIWSLLQVLSRLADGINTSPFDLSSILKNRKV